MSLVKKCTKVDHFAVSVEFFHLCCCWSYLIVQKYAFQTLGICFLLGYKAYLIDALLLSK